LKLPPIPTKTQTADYQTGISQKQKKRRFSEKKSLTLFVFKNSLF
jgi:hypothetical protein